MHIEDWIRWLIVIVTLLLIASALASCRNNKRVKLSLVLSIAATGLFILGVYTMGLEIGDEPAGFAEGKFVGLALAMYALCCSLIVATAFGLGIYALFKDNTANAEAVSAIAISLISLGVIVIPILLAFAPPTLQMLGFFIRNINWLSAVYSIADWSRAADSLINR